MSSRAPPGVGKDADHAATCRRMLQLAAGTDDITTANHAARAYCLHPSSEPQLPDSVVTLARSARDIDKDDPWNQLALGMAEYRHDIRQFAGFESLQQTQSPCYKPLMVQRFTLWSLIPMSRRTYYSPCISRELVRALYHEARHRRQPMTCLVDELLSGVPYGSSSSGL